MNKPMINEHDCITQTAVLREMTDEEYAQHLIDKEVSEANRANLSAMLNPNE